MFGRALVAKELALMRLQHAFEHFAALRRLRIGDSNSRNLETLLRVPFRVALAETQGRLRNKTESSPFEIRAQLENFGHGAERGTIPFPWNDSLVLILDSGLVGLQLAQHHDDGLENVQRFESGDRDRLVLVLRDPFIGPAADDRRYVAGANEGVDAHVGRIEDGANRRDDSYVVAEYGKIVDTLRFRAHERERCGGSGGLESNGKEHHVPVGIFFSQF